MPRHVVVLDADGDQFVATLDDRSQVRARSVVLALGMDPHRRLPAELLALLPERSWRHTCDAVDLTGAAGRRYLLVGGRQSAFEWAALLTEAGAASVDVVHRHDSPAFAPAHWGWVTGVVDRMAAEPGCRPTGSGSGRARPSCPATAPAAGRSRSRSTTGRP